MAETLSKEFLSGFSSKPMLTITGTSTGTANTLHTADATAKDEVWLWATNEDATTAVLTLELTAATEPIVVTINPRSEPKKLIPGWIFTGSDTLKAFATGGTVMVQGHVNRITAS